MNKEKVLNWIDERIKSLRTTEYKAEKEQSIAQEALEALTYIKNNIG